MLTEVRSTSNPRAPWPLTGRRLELEQCLAIVADPEQRALVIAGPAGVGKSRLADELRRGVDAQGGRTAHVIASEAAQSVPLASIAHLLPNGVPVDDLAALVRSLRALAASDEHRTLLVVDDVHLLDATSAAVIGSALVAGDLFLVATLRSGSKVPGAVDALWRSGVAARIELQDLERQSIETLLHRALGGPVAADGTEQLWESSRGNALFLRELVLGSVASGALREVDGCWRLDGLPAVTDGLRELVVDRHDAVGGVERMVLDALAIAGPVGVSEVAISSGLHDLDPLETSGLIEIVRSDRRVEAQLTHPLHGEVLRETMSSGRARDLRRACIARVEMHGARRCGDVGLLASWSLDADGTADTTVLTRAAQLARQAHDFPSVKRLARAALTDAGDPELTQLLAEASYQTGAFEEAESVLAALDLRDCTDRERLLATITRVTNLYWGLRRPSDAFAVGDAVIATVGGDDQIELRAQQASLLGFCGRLPEAIARADEPSGNATARARAARAIARAPVLAMMGATAEAQAVAEQGFRDHQSIDPMLAIAHPGTHIVAVSLALAEAGRLGEARELATAGYGEAISERIPIAAIWFALLLGRIALAEGRPETALRWFRDNVARCHAVGHQLPERLGAAGVAFASAYLGQPDAGSLEPQADHDPWFALFGGDVTRARAWTLVGLGRPVEAFEELHAAADELSAASGVQQAAAVLHDLARLGDLTVAPALDEIAARSDSRLVAVFAQHARGRASRDESVLGLVGEQFFEMGAQLYAAEAWIAAADAARRSGHGRAATGYQRRADECRPSLEGARTPGLAVAEVVEPLTDREREVSLLAAAGVPSKEIAEQLFLSVRTVNNHLQRAYTKLGVASRGELAAALRTEGKR